MTWLLIAALLLTLSVWHVVTVDRRTRRDLARILGPEHASHTQKLAALRKAVER